MDREILRDGRTLFLLLLLLHRGARAFRLTPARQANPSAFPAGRPSPWASSQTRPASSRAAGLPGPPGAARLSPLLSPPNVKSAAGLPASLGRAHGRCLCPCASGSAAEPRVGPRRGGDGRPYGIELGGKEGAPDPPPSRGQPRQPPPPAHRRAGHKMAAPPFPPPTRPPPPAAPAGRPHAPARRRALPGAPSAAKRRCTPRPLTPLPGPGAARRLAPCAGVRGRRRPF